MDKKQQTTATYNASAEELSRYYAHIGPRIQEIEKAFSYSSKENPFVVEIGCGSGREAKEILKRTNHYLGLDISSSMIALAKKNVPYAEFQIADIEKVILPKNIDIVFAFASLLHSNKETLREIFEKIQQSLVAGGLTLLTLKMADSKEYCEQTITDSFGTRTYYFYTPEILREITEGIFSTVSLDLSHAQGNEWITLFLKK